MAACESGDGFGPEGLSWQPMSHLTVLDHRVTPGPGVLAACESRDVFGPEGLSWQPVGSGPFRAERRRREARREIFSTPGHVTARQSILGPPAEGRPGPITQKVASLLIIVLIFEEFASNQGMHRTHLNGQRISYKCTTGHLLRVLFILGQSCVSTPGYSKELME